MDKTSKKIKGMSSNAPDLTSRLYYLFELSSRYSKNNSRLTNESPMGETCLSSSKLKFKRKAMNSTTLPTLITTTHKVYTETSPLRNINSKKALQADSSFPALPLVGTMTTVSSTSTLPLEDQFNTTNQTGNNNQNRMEEEEDDVFSLHKKPHYGKFIESLNLDEATLDDFSKGNFLYLLPRNKRPSKNKYLYGYYDMMVVPHSEIQNDNTSSFLNNNKDSNNSSGRKSTLGGTAGRKSMIGGGGSASTSSLTTTNTFAKQSSIISDYYTLSKHGITHFYENECEFTSLEQFEREYTIFNTIKEIPFFEKYPIWKSYTWWKKNLHYKKIAQASEAIDKNYFILNPILRECMFKIRLLCVEAHTECKLFSLGYSKTLDLEEFTKEQGKRKAYAINYLEQFNVKTRLLLRTSCDKVLDAFLVANNISADQKMSFTKKAALRSECRRLTRFIRLTDFVIAHTLIEICIESLDELYQSIEPPNLPPNKIRTEEVIEESTNTANNPDEYHPLISTIVSVSETDGNISVSPNYKDTWDRFDRLISNGVDIINHNEMLLTHEDLKPYTMAVTEEDSDMDLSEENILGNVFMKMEQYTEFVEKIKNGLNHSFEEVTEYCKCFEPYRDIYLENNNTEQNVQTLFHDSPADVWKKTIEKYYKQYKELEDIPSSADITVLYVDSIETKANIKPTPMSCISAMHEMLPGLIAELTTELLTELKMRNQKVSSTPTSVEEFVEKVKFLNECAEAMPLAKTKYERINDLCEVMENNEWELSETQNANNISLTDLMNTIEEGLRYCEGNLEQDKKVFAAKIAKEIPVLKRNVITVREQLEYAMIGNPDAPIDDVIEFLEKQEKEVQKLTEQSQKYESYQILLNQEVQQYEVLDEVAMDLKCKMQLWKGLKEWGELTEKWKNTPLDKINTDELNKYVQQYNKAVAICARGLPGSRVVPKFKQMVEDFKTLLPVILDLRNPHLQQRHLQEIQEIIGHTFEEGKSYSLGELIQLNVIIHQPEINRIANNAVQEAALLDLLQVKVKSVWKDLEFEVLPYKEQKDVFILGAPDDIIAALDDSLVTLNTIMGSRYCSPIRDEVEYWQKKLMLLQETMDEWFNCQKQWMYLETIFSAGDIQRQLPQETKLFEQIDRNWKDIMRRVNANPNAVTAGTLKGLKETLIKNNEVLDKIQKSLEDYLETKRQAFPRFYFLSNDELLEILVQTRNVQAVQPHLRKCFDQIMKLDFGAEASSIDIFAMISGEGERVPLGKNLKARGQVEEWLTAVQNDMKKTIKKLIYEGVVDYEKEKRPQWVMDHFGQVVATAAQIMWTRNTEKALTSDNPIQALRTWYDQNKVQLSQMTALVRGQLTANQRKIIVALVTTDVHARDIIESLCLKRVDSINSFSWQMQLRYYWDKDQEECVVRQSSTELIYGYEYQGCTSRLVITPLTDRCWMTITGAIRLSLGAAPAGPAGTGKTESSKDLAKALGILCVVFNCSDQIDYKMLGKLFSGLAQCGCWTCLDEFNRIDIEVLSVVAQQLLTLRQGLLGTDEKIVFEGTLIPIYPHIVIITMNPGYAGRTELPDNLKIFFRPVSMMVPDYALIAEIMLFAEGFDDSKNLSRKMVRLYKLSSEQLSQQHHYDYGLRAVKSVLVMAGSLKRSNPTLSEDVVLIRAMRDSNVPKFLADDLPLFHAIVNDLFPNVVVPVNDTGELQETLVDEIEKAGLQPKEEFLTKTIQLYETFNVRFGVVLVGPSGGGKTTSYRILAKSMGTLRDKESKNETFQHVTYTVINPKAITMGELYGEFNELTQEWRDGLASSIIRYATTFEDEDRRWTVFDGPIDALWIENMNTVLDDNQTLCLANGQRIKLRNQMRMLFEVGDLEEASPATVSRLGVVFVPETTLGWRPYVTTWLASTFPEFDEETHEFIQSLFDNNIDEVIEFQRKKCQEPIKTMDINLIASLCILFTQLLKECKINLIELDVDYRHEHLQNYFAYSLIWSIGISLRDEDVLPFDDHIQHKFKDIMFGPRGAYDVYYDENKREFVSWSEIVPKFQYDMNAPYFSIIVPTVDTVRYEKILRTDMHAHRSAFLTGVTGTGKTVIIQSLLNHMGANEEDGGEGTLNIMLNFSAQTSSLATQASIEDKLEKKRKNLLGGPAGKKVIIFVDDVNMPAVEQYGAQPPIELLRQFEDFNGFYDRDKLFWKDIMDTTLLVAAAPPGGGRNKVTQRFTRHCHMMSVPAAGDEVLEKIFGSILNGFLEGFSKDIQRLSRAMLRGTIEVYCNVKANLKPTPAKSHYTFNLRDVSKVIQGCLMVRPREVSLPNVMIQLWAHECLRIFCDRLINDEDKNWFAENLVRVITSEFHISSDGFEVEQFIGKDSIMFVDWIKPRIDNISIYELSRDYKKTVKVLDDMLEDYNNDFTNKMKLVFFRNATEHVSRIARILRQPRGNAMLVGVGGSGKQSLTRMACYMASIKCFQIELTRGYGINEFHDDIKKLMQVAGIEGNQIVFLFTDNHIVKEQFLEDVNNVLNTGEVPNLYANDEKNKLIEDIRPVVRKMGLPESRDICYQTFVQRVRDNLHIVLCMSPVGDSLRVRCRQFPSLINCCTIDWFMPWPYDALISVANRFLTEVNLGGDNIREILANECAQIHLDVEVYATKFFNELRRKVYTTPKSYLDLINSYISMLQERRDEINASKNKLATGVGKLEETNSVVASLQEELTKLEPVLTKKSEETEVLVEKVSEEKADADALEAKVTQEAAIVEKQANEVNALRADAQADLDVAMPALNSAIEALDKLDKKDVTEVKSFTKPPPAVQVVMEAVCILLGEKPDWDNSKKLLGRSDFMNLLKNYDKDKIPPQVIKKLIAYVNNDQMRIENVQRVSVAATSICMWIHAMYNYSEVAKVVEPKRKILAEMDAKYALAKGELDKKLAQLQEVKDAVQEKTDLLNRTMEELNQLKADQKLTADRLGRAQKLTTGLADEQVRWKESVKTYDEQLLTLVGDVFISAACISYYGAFTGPYRESMIEEWFGRIKEKEVPSSDKFSLFGTLGDPIVLREWNINGLPTDTVSTDNAVLATRGKRWPLMIDPQEQAKKWIKQMEAKSHLEVIRMDNANMLRSLENCIRIGRPLLIEDIGEFLDPALDPVLQKSIFQNAGRTLIHLGDSDVDYDESFKFYLTTKLPNPHYLPEICIKVTIINFTVTFEGLEDQLKGNVIAVERPDVEEKKNNLVVSMSNDKKQLKQIEDKILRQISESSGNILDDEELIQILQDSKVISAVIKERLAESEKTAEEINIIRNQYESVAERGSIIYFVIADLSNVDPMYQYSLSYFIRLFDMCLRNAEKSDDLEQRLKNLMKYMTSVIYSNICRGLFEKDKLLFSVLLCVQILRHSGVVSDNEWKVLLKGAGMIVNPLPNPDSKFIIPNSWNTISAAEEMLDLPGLGQHITDNLEEWKKWAESKEPYREPLPGGDEWNEKIQRIRKVLMIKLLSEDKLIFGLMGFVKDYLGNEFVEYPPTAMVDVYNDTDYKTPVIFVLSTGADPTGMLLNFAKQKNYTERLTVIALGQGQGKRAAAAIEKACKTGDWVMLQNCHLAKSWMGALEKIVDGFSARGDNQPKIHPDFRLFLTSMPTNYFPVPILQNGVKLTNEPPKGIKANLLRSMQNLENWTDFEKCRDLFSWKKIVFGLSFFHAVIQERRKFGPLGFNIRYEFNDSDLETSVQVLKMFIDEHEKVPWEALTYVCGQINYGGRVTDDLDRRCLMCILNVYITPDVLKDNYKFSPSGIYYSIPTGSLMEYIKYVKSLPLNDNPEIFGMHNNANVAYQVEESRKLLDTCLSVQPRDSANASGKSTDEIVLELAQEIETKIPNNMLMEEAGSKTFIEVNGVMDSLATLLSHEIDKFNNLLNVIRSTLSRTQKAIKGEELMDDVLDRMYTAVNNNKVPDVWENAAYPSLKPLASWVTDLELRVEQLRNWLKNGKPDAFWLSGFYFPQGFLTGALQSHARKYAIPIDTLNFSFSILPYEDVKEITQGPNDGVYIYGLFCDGVRWDKSNQILADSNPGEMYCTAPFIHFLSVVNYQTPVGQYSCPVYKTSTRAGTLSTTGISTNYVISVDFPTDKNPDYWVLKGSALLCQLDD